MEGKSMKILMTADPMGGVWTYCMELCRQLEHLGVEVHLATMGAFPDTSQRLAVAGLLHVKLYQSDYKLEWMDNPWYHLEKSKAWLEEIVVQVQPDLIHFNNFGQVDHDWGCPVITTFHSCVLSWWRAVKGHEAPGEQWGRYRELVKDALSASDVVVAPTKAILNEMQTIYGEVYDGRCIYNGRSESRHVSEKYRPFIFCSGRVWDDAKNLKILEEVAPLVEWPIYIAGNNCDPLSGKKTQLENVHFLGQLHPESVREWMSRASIYVLPAKYEPFGLSALEAAQAECALLLSNIDTLKELWTDAACFFDPADPHDIAAKINKVAGNCLLRKDLSAAAYHKAQSYQVDTMAHQYFQLYQELISSRSEELPIQKSAV